MERKGENRFPLYSLQDKVLQVISEFAKEHDFPFILTGGTALVRFLLRNPYRISYDLDFFSDRLNVFNGWDRKNLKSFLLRHFDVVIFSDLSSQSLKMWKGVVGNNNITVNLDFVDDQFSGIFETIPLEDFNPLEVETPKGIYFRKLFAVITGTQNEDRVVERIKDVVDLIELDKKIPLVDFVADEFMTIIQQNFGTPDIEEFLTKFRLLYKIVKRNSEKVNIILNEKLLTTVTVQDLLRWVEKKLEVLTKYFQQNL